MRIFSIIAAVLFINTAMAQSRSIPSYILNAVDNPSRPQADRDHDANRKPAEVIAFAGIKPGDKIADLMPGGGYFTRIFCTIVGAQGHVYAVTVPRHINALSQSASSQSSGSSPTDACSNITHITLKAANRSAPELHSDSDDPGWVYEYYQVRPAAENFAVPEPLDMIWTSENYHDLHNAAFGPADMQRVNQALFNALKPGGILMIEDHASRTGSGDKETQSLYRIEPAFVKKEVETAGFVFVAASGVLHHSEDDHRTRAHDMHDRTDRFLFKFRKP